MTLIAKSLTRSPCQSLVYMKIYLLEDFSMYPVVDNSYADINLWGEDCIDVVNGHETV